MIRLTPNRHRLHNCTAVGHALVPSVLTSRPAASWRRLKGTDSAGELITAAGSTAPRVRRAEGVVAPATLTGLTDPAWLSRLASLSGRSDARCAGARSLHLCGVHKCPLVVVA